MMRKPSRHLLDMLAALPDPRKEKGEPTPPTEGDSTFISTASRG